MFIVQATKFTRLKDWYRQQNKEIFHCVNLLILSHACQDKNAMSRYREHSIAITNNDFKTGVNLIKLFWRICSIIFRKLEHFVNVN
jgi:hypothetical protein